MMIHPHHIDAAKTVADVASLGAVAAAWVGYLTPLSTVIAFVYLLVRLHETKTVRRMEQQIREWWGSFGG